MGWDGLRCCFGWFWLVGGGWGGGGAGGLCGFFGVFEVVGMGWVDGMDGMDGIFILSKVFWGEVEGLIGLMGLMGSFDEDWCRCGFVFSFGWWGKGGKGEGEIGTTTTLGCVFFFCFLVFLSSSLFGWAGLFHFMGTLGLFPFVSLSSSLVRWVVSLHGYVGALLFRYLCGHYLSCVSGGLSFFFFEFQAPACLCWPGDLRGGGDHVLGGVDRGSSCEGCGV